MNEGLAKPRCRNRSPRSAARPNRIRRRSSPPTSPRNTRNGLRSARPRREGELKALDLAKKEPGSDRQGFARYIDDRPRDRVFRVDRSIYNDPEILEAEYRNIFEANWVFLCHEAHIRKPGDFFATHIGRQPVFVVRKPDGTLGCYLNACGHRGATLVTARTGNATSFVCPYHGFCFDPAGKCTAVTAPKTGWSEAHFDMSEFDLTPIARLDSYRGFVFGSLAADVPDLRDHLGAAKALIDIFVAPAPQELEIVAGFSIYQTACNWKIMHENGPDAYHAPVVHNNFAQAINFREKREARSGVAKTDTGRLTGRIESASYDLGNGHTAFWHKRPDPEAFPIYAQKDELEKTLHARPDRMDSRPWPPHDDLPQSPAQ